MHIHTLHTVYCMIYCVVIFTRTPVRFTVLPKYQTLSEISAGISVHYESITFSCPKVLYVGRQTFIGSVMHSSLQYMLFY